MARTLIINPGSTSRKYALYHNGMRKAVVFCEATGKGFEATLTVEGKVVLHELLSATQFTHALSYALDCLEDKDILSARHDITHVGMRIVAPGSYFMQHRIVDEVYVAKLRDCASVAPLHIPVVLDEIAASQKELSHTSIAAVSDSAFHSSIPEHVRRISISKADAERYDIQRFGYHGLSIASVARRVPELLGTMPRRTIVCHIGGGVSIAALSDGVSVATSMGYTPASGMIMGSRGGDVTAGVLATLVQKKKLSGKRLYEYLYQESGFQGVAGVRDLRLVLEHAAQGKEDAQLALNMFAHQAQAWIGSHVVQLGGLDAIVLTATAVERNPYVRSLLMDGLEVFGVHVDHDKNDSCISCEGVISAASSDVQVLVMKTDEMGEVLRQTHILSG